MTREEFLAQQLSGLKTRVQEKIEDVLPDFEEFHTNTDLAKIETLSWILDELNKITFRYSRRLENE